MVKLRSIGQSRVLTSTGGRLINRRVTAAEQTKRSYERRPYPGPDIGKLVGKGGSLPSLKWMQAIGRPDQPEPDRVLVAGCGTGVEAFVIRRRWPKAEIVAVDFSPRSIAVARRLQRSAGVVRPITFLVADLTDPELAVHTGGRFDLITCHGVLSYIPKPGKVLTHFAACLRPGGALYLGVNGESHPATRLRPWLERFGLDVVEMKDERRLRELLRLWDCLHDDGARDFATMSASYLAGDICGPHFNNWPMDRWRSEANRCGWEVAGVWLLPLALRLTIEHGNHSPLFPAGIGEVAERLDRARPAGFHKIVLRRAKPGELDVEFGKNSERRLRWTGLYSVRFVRLPGSGTSTAVLRCPTFNLRLDWPLTAGQVETLRTLVDSGVFPIGWQRHWIRSEASRRILWLWTGLGVVTISRIACPPAST